MTNDITEAVRRLKQLSEDVERLKAAENEEGVVRILRLVKERNTSSDTATARSNDAEATDRSTTGDTVSASTSPSGNWTWGQSNWNFDEWANAIEQSLKRIVRDRSTTGDAATWRSNDAETTDRSTTGDTATARSNDAEATDRSTTGDTVSASTSPSGGWVWGQSNWNFDEWADGN